MDDLKGKRVTVLGLGHFGGGIAVSRWLTEQGARVLVTDKAGPDKLKDAVAQLAGVPIEFRLGQQLEEDFTAADLVVASPAVRPDNPLLQAARAAGVPITTEIRLFVERLPAGVRTIGVTGTKGKSTTTAMLGAMLQRRFRTWVGGNIGGSLLSNLPRIERDHIVVLELSSFMLEYLGEAQWSPHVAVVTMIAPDHLDRHGTFANYVAAKSNIVRFQRASDVAVLNGACRHALDFAKMTPARVVFYGQGPAEPFALKVPGAHNQLNAQAAFAAAQAVGVSREDAAGALAEFAGLPHRLELVHESAGVRYFNDSIATIPQAAVAAMESFPPGRVIQIVGGDDKKLPMEQMRPMCDALARRAKAVICIGRAGPALAAMTTEAAGPCVRSCENLGAAVEAARSLSESGDVVLLSPGCASYGEFTNFEERGKRFAKLARCAG